MRTLAVTVWIGTSIAACGDAAGPAADAATSGSTATAEGMPTGTAGTGSAGTGVGPVDGTASSSGGSLLDLPIFDVGGVGDMGIGGRACSGDLRQVVDADTGAVLEQCPPEQGCLDGRCVEACLAAAASQSSLGCELVVPTSPFYANGNPSAVQSGPCHALLVSNAWDRPAMLELWREGVQLDVEAATWIPSGIGLGTTYDPLPGDGLPSREVAVVFLSHRPGVHNGNSLECPREPAVLADTAVHGTGQGEAFVLVSDTPVLVYDVIPYGGAPTYLPSASLLYPSTAWGQQYLVPTPHRPDGAEWILAVAREDDTTIELQPTVAMTPGSLVDPPPGVVTQYVLDAGEVAQWQSDTDPAGTTLVADQPIGVLAGNTYLRVDTADDPQSGRDSAHQMIPAVSALGSEYVGAGLYSRLPRLAPESVRYRLVGVVDGTALAWDPAAPAGAPAAIDAGEVVEFESRDAFSVASQDEAHPFSLAQYMSGSLEGQPGCVDPPAKCRLGDDDWVVLVPAAQLLRAYAFFVDPTYGTTTLVLVRAAGNAFGFSPVELECMGAVEGWQPVGDDGRFEYAHVELYRTGSIGVPACATSQHFAQSDGNFGVIVWGTDHGASYGYPAGGNLQTLNQVGVQR